MKLIETSPLRLYWKPISSWDDWITIKNSGRWHPSEVNSDFDCGETKLPNLIGAPSYIGGHFSCRSSGLTSLEGTPKTVYGNYDMIDNDISSLKNIHKQIKLIGGALYTINNPIDSNILGLLLIKDLRRIVSSLQCEKIINKHLSGDKDVLECQEELISAGYKEYAKL